MVLESSSAIVYMKTHKNALSAKQVFGLHHFASL